MYILVFLTVISGITDSQSQPLAKNTSTIPSADQKPQQQQHRQQQHQQQQQSLFTMYYWQVAPLIYKSDDVASSTDNEEGICLSVKGI